MSNASVTISGLAEGSKNSELEPLGMDAGAFHLLAPPPPAFNHPPLKDARGYPGFADPATGQCRLDYIDIPCDMAMTMVNQSGSAMPCPPEGCGPQVRDGKLEPLMVDPKTGKLVYGHWGDTGGFAAKDWDGIDGHQAGEVNESSPGHREFVVDGVAVTTTFFVLNVGTSQQNPTPTPAPQQQPIYCQPDVIKAMKRAWMRTGNGVLGNEAGFVLNGNPSKYEIVEVKSGNTPGYQRMPINTGGDNPTFALFHVHQNGGGAYPSTPGNNRLNNKKGDTGIADEKGIPFYVISSSGLTMYDPKTKEVTMLRENLDWTKPCK